jgi:hypothetical protein
MFFLEVLLHFGEEKIELPFAQLDLHLKSIEAPVSISTLQRGAL